MQVTIIKDKQGVLVTSGMAKLYKRNKLVGYCLDTPNAVACVIGNNLATKAVDTWGEEIKVSKDRIENKGWMSVSACNFVKA